MQQQIILEEFIKIQPKGLITIPKKFRQELNFQENQLVKIRKEKGRLLIEPVKTIPYLVRTYTDAEIKQFLALDRQQAKELRKKKIIK